MRASIWDRLQRHSSSLFKDFVNDIKFSVRLGFVRAYNHLFAIRSSTGSTIKLQNELVISAIENLIPETLAKKFTTDAIPENRDLAPIWVCWWDGFEQAPSLVKLCINCIQNHAGKHEVVFIDKNTVNQYLMIPDFILEKAQKKQMMLANLCDYVRVALLEKYGGLWLDATIFVSQDIPDWWFSLDVFSIKSIGKDNAMSSRYIANGRWTTFCIGGKRGQVLFQFLKSAFEEYWSTSETIIDYLLFDYLIEIAYEKVCGVKEQIDSIPENNIHHNTLRDAMLADRSASDFEKVIYSDTALYKLSWKARYGLQTAAGEDTIYSYLLKH